MQRRTIQRLSLALFVITILWGLFTVFIYYGIPVHGRVLMNGEAFKAVESGCDSTAFFCRGAHALLPSIAHTFHRLRPFFGYALLSLMFYGIFLAWQCVKTGYAPKRFQWRPRTIAGLFLGSTWLLFTVLTNANYSQGGESSVSIRRVVEPHPEIYRNVGEEGMAELKTNFNRLLEKNCLTLKRHLRPDAREFTLKNSCMQMTFFQKAGAQIIFLGLLILTFLTTGRWLLHLLRFRLNRVFIEAVMSFGLGACAWMMILWVLAVAHLFKQPVGWIAIFIVLAGGYKHARYWLLTFWEHRWETQRSWKSPLLLVGWILLTLCAVNFLTVLRPFPIGWDDIGSYLNRPRLLSSYGSFIYNMAPFQWEYLTSLGFMLYGYDSIVGSTTAMMINWLAGPFAFLVVIATVQIFLGGGTGLIAGLLYYLLPMVGHFSFADMKTDNAVFALQAISIFTLLCALFLRTKDEEDGERHVEEQELEQSSGKKCWLQCVDWQWFLLAGIFCGFAFGTKPTAIMTAFTLGMMTLGTLLHPSAAIGVAALTIPVYIKTGALNIVAVLERVGWGDLSMNAVLYGSFIVGIVCLAYAVSRAKDKMQHALQATALLAIGFLAAVAPWIAHNNVLKKDVGLHLFAPNQLSPVFDTDGSLTSPAYEVPIRKLPPELQIDKSHPTCNATAREEELGRYWGFRQGWGHYITLPWRSVMNLDSAGYYVTTNPSLLLFPLLLLLPAFWLPVSRWLRWLTAGSIFLTVQWIFLANGVPWYGIAMFLGPIVALEVMILKAPDRQNRIALSILVALGILSCICMRMWQFDQQRNLLEFPMGKASAATMRERTIPHYNNIRDVVMERHESIADRPYLYRIGTFIPYFIPKNLEVIGMEDHQVDFFNCLHQERNNQLTLKRLKALGFNSIIFDTNTATIERNPNGTLHKKVETFVNFLNDTSLNLQVLINDPGAGVVYIIIP